MRARACLRSGASRASAPVRRSSSPAPGRTSTATAARPPRPWRGSELADRIVVFQQHALAELPDTLRERSRVVYQSVLVPPELRDLAPTGERFRVALVANLRAVKDPLSVARAARHLPAQSRVAVHHAGAVLEPDLPRRGPPRGTREPALHLRRRAGPPRGPAFRRDLSPHRGPLPPRRRRLEPWPSALPSLCTRIPGSTGLIGDDYPASTPRATNAP